MSNEPRELSEEELKAIKAKALFEAAEYEAKLNALPKQCAIDTKRMEIELEKVEATHTAVMLASEDLKATKELVSESMIAFLEEEPPVEKKKGRLGSKHETTVARRNLVRVMIGTGASEARIAKVLNISHDSLRRHYKPQLDQARELWGTTLESRLNFCSALAMSENGRTGALTLLATNHSRLKQGKSLDVTSSDGSLGGKTVVFLTSEKRGSSGDDQKLLEQLQEEFPADGVTVEGELVGEGEGDNVSDE